MLWLAWDKDFLLPSCIGYLKEVKAMFDDIHCVAEAIMAPSCFSISFPFSIMFNMGHWISAWNVAETDALLELLYETAAFALTDAANDKFETIDSETGEPETHPRETIGMLRMHWEVFIQDTRHR